MSTCSKCSKELPTPLDEYGPAKEPVCRQCFFELAEIKSLETDKEISTLEEEIVTIERKISRLEDEITELDEKSAELRSKITKLKSGQPVTDKTKRPSWLNSFPTRFSPITTKGEE